MAKLARVLDSWPLLAYFQNQPAASQVTEIFKEASKDGRDLLISSVNWGEILYVMDRQYGPAKRDHAENLMEQMRLEVMPVDKQIAREAAHFKMTYKLGYADCFAAALTFLRDAELVTGDRDFRVLKDHIRILWL